MARMADAKNLTEAITLLASSSLTVDQMRGFRGIVRMTEMVGGTVPSVSPKAAIKASQATGKPSGTVGPRKTGDPNAPYGLKADGTPRQKPGRKVTPPVEAPAPVVEKPRVAARPRKRTVESVEI